MSKPRRPRDRTAAAVLGATLLAGAGVLHALISPWPLVVVVAGLLVLALGRCGSWLFALAVAPLVLLVGALAVVRVAPALGLDLASASLVALLATAAVTLALLVMSSARPLPAPRGIAAIATIPALVTAVGIVATAVGVAGITWAMRGDAVWNLITARFLLEDGGITSDGRPNGSPMTATLIGLAAASGRVGVAPGDLLAHDVGRAAQLWFALFVTSALLAGAVGLLESAGASRGYRIAAVVGAEFVVLSWFMLGFALQFGHYNTTLSVIVLLATWLAWRRNARSPIAAAAAMSLAALALLATWAPLVLVPAALAVPVLVRVVREEGLRRPRPWATLILLLPAPVYAGVVTLADLRRDGAALAVDGGILPIAPWHVAVLLVATAGIVLLARDRRVAEGLALVVVAAGIAFGYLLLQRVGQPSLWGYYPVKLTWIVVTVLLVVVAGLVARVLSRLRWRRTVAAIVAVVAAGALVGQAIYVGPVRVLAPVEVLVGSLVEPGEPAAHELLEIASPGERAVAIGLTVDDGFVNAWLLQLESTAATDPIRLYSYVLNTADVGQVCDVLALWGPGVVVHTRNDGLAAELAAACPETSPVVRRADG